MTVEEPEQQQEKEENVFLIVRLYIPNGALATVIIYAFWQPLCVASPGYVSKYDNIPILSLKVL